MQKRKVVVTELEDSISIDVSCMGNARDEADKHGTAIKVLRWAIKMLNEDIDRLSGKVLPKSPMDALCEHVMHTMETDPRLQDIGEIMRMAGDPHVSSDEFAAYLDKQDHTTIYTDMLKEKRKIAFENEAGA